MPQENSGPTECNKYFISIEVFYNVITKNVN